MWFFVIAALVLLISEPIRPKSRAPVPLSENISDARVSYYGRIDREAASSQLGRRSQQLAMQLSEKADHVRHFEYRLAKTFFDIVGKDSILVVLLIDPDGDSCVIPDAHRFLIRRGEETWESSRAFVVRYAARGGYLEPELEFVGGEAPAELTPNDSLDLAPGFVEAMDGRLYGMRAASDRDLVTLFVVAPLRSSGGVVWDPENRKPFGIVLEPRPAEGII